MHNPFIAYPIVVLVGIGIGSVVTLAYWAIQEHKAKHEN